MPSSFRRWAIGAETALPLGIAMMMIALMTAVPRYLVGHYLGMHTLGIFVMILYLALVGSKLSAALTQSAGPRLAKHYAAGDTAAYCRLLLKLLGWIAGLGIAVVSAVALLGGPILGMLYGPEFSRYATLAVYLMMAGTMMYLATPLGMAIDAMRRFKTHLAIRAAGILTLLAVLPGLLQTHGLKGAAMAMFGSYALTVLGCAGAVVCGVRLSLSSCQLSVSSCQLSVSSCQSSVISRQLSAIGQTEGRKLRTEN